MDKVKIIVFENKSAKRIIQYMSDIHNFICTLNSKGNIELTDLKVMVQILSDTSKFNSSTFVNKQYSITKAALRIFRNDIDWITNILSSYINTVDKDIKDMLDKLLVEKPKDNYEEMSKEELIAFLRKKS